MKLNFLYDNIAGVQIPDKNFLGLYKPGSFNIEKDADELIREALDNPIGSNRLEELLKAGDRVLILSDDNTRATPVARILEVFLPRLREIGIKKTDISFLIATGTHRPMNKEELIAKLGKVVVSEYKIENHQWDRDEDNVYYGETSKGIKVFGNKRLKEADFVIGLGHIVPHRVAGFSGGGKIVQPGVCNGLTTGKTHWMSALVSGEEIIGKRDNPVREQIDEAAQLMGLDYIINVVQDASGKIAGVFCGDFIEAHRSGCQLAKKIYGVKIPRADIVITDSYPADLELWQAAKGIYSSELIVNDGGFVILVTPCPEGVAITHPEIEDIGYKSFTEVKALVDEKRLEELSVAAHLVHVGRVIRERATGILVSPGIPHNIKESIGFVSADTVEEALAYAFREKGKDATVVAVLNAGELLPVVEN